MDERRTRAIHLLTTYPQWVPVIVNPMPSSLKLKQRKFLPKRDCTIAQLMYAIRSNAILKSDEALFPFCEGEMPPFGSSIGQLYDNMKSPDKFLYLTIMRENTFGAI